MNTPKIITARQLPEAMMAALSQFGAVEVLAADRSNLSGAVALVSVAVDPVQAELLTSASDSLRLVANIGVGTDNIDLAKASQLGIMVSNTPVVTEDTADLAMSLMLATCRRLNHCEKLLRAGDFAAGASHLGVRVHGKTLGLIGFGAIGQAVARRARGFGMTILYHGPRPKVEEATTLGAQYCASLSDLLARSDIVSLHCPLSDNTHHIINAETLSMMRPGAILINTGRGALVHEAALVEALAAGHLGGAGLDVFEFEPQVTEALKDFNNVTLTPHIGSATAECRQDMAMRLVANLKQFLDAGSVIDRVV